MPLWEKQWDIYGKCVSYDSLINTIFKYFNFALKEALELDLLKHLASIGIRPDSSTYIGKAEFQWALQTIYNHDVSLRCKPYKAEKLTHMYVMNGTFGHKINGTNTLDRNKIRFTRQPRNRTVDQGNLNLRQLDEVIFCFSEYLQLIDCPMYTQKNNSCEDGFVFAEFSKETEYVKQLGIQTFKDCNCTECPKLNTTMKRLV
uniref:SJCHGC04603 protein n=1 Tax=Schistosoma japonicum TaxID=6182 RepID=Q5DG33_SCHJA|nr:SJCHGC04603 protein [Schistosoma japonicum]